MSRILLNPTASGFILAAILVLFNSAVAPAQFCQDDIWQAGEFCGHDALVVTGKAEMNHDCILDFLDICLFYSQFGMTGPYQSADLNGDGVVNVSDAGDFVASFSSDNLVDPCTPSPVTPDYCGTTLSLSLHPDIIVSRGRLASPGLVGVHVVASGWLNAGAIEYALVTTPNALIQGETSPVGWSSIFNADEGAKYYCWYGTGVPVATPTVVAIHYVWITDTQPVSIELVDYGGPLNLLTRWAPTTLDHRTEFQVRRNVGINTIDPVSTTGCLSPYSPPNLAITDPPGHIYVSTTAYGIAGWASDSDGTIDFVEYRVNEGLWQLATGNWTATVNLAVGPNWVQVRTADDSGAYSSTQVVTIERLATPFDLAVTAWSGTDALPAGCQSVDVSVTVGNVSAGPTPSCRLGFYVSPDAVIDASDYLVDTYLVPALPAGGSDVINTTLAISDAGPRGAVYLGALVDDQHVLFETNETNNTGSNPFDFPVPAINSVADVDNDQGRTVRLNLSGSSRDALGSPAPVLQYEAFRRIVPSTKYSVRESAAVVKGVQISDPAKMVNWEFVGAVPAHGESEYNMVVPTLADSTDQGVRWSVFFVRAATAQPLVFFDSCADSGYSVDNLAPSAPKAIAAAYQASGVTLDWDDAPETDFRYYRIYRDTDPAFVPSSDTLVQETSASAWVDPIADPWGNHYQITTLDYAGNESDAGLPSNVTGVRDGAVPSRTALLGAVPNPFNPSTKLSFEIAVTSPVQLKIYDAAGRLVRILVDEQRDAGLHEVIWDGRDTVGRMSAAGVYLYRLEAGEYVESKRMTLIK